VLVKRYLVIIEPSAGGYRAYSPDLPVSISTGATRAAIEANMRDAIEFHIEGLKLEGLPVPEPSSGACVRRSRRQTMMGADEKRAPRRDRRGASCFIAPSQLAQESAAAR
jgi:predicted RNase H-like HicB family nuclease